MAAAPGATKAVLCCLERVLLLLLPPTMLFSFPPPFLFIPMGGEEEKVVSALLVSELANGESDKRFWECAVENEEGDWDLPVCQQ